MSSGVKGAISFSPVEKSYYPEWGFRPGTQMYPITMGFVFLNGGMGDYINWLTPIQWLASEATWIKGTLICPIYLTELAEYFLKPYPNWCGVKAYNKISEIPRLDDTPTRGPIILQQESLNATGAHLSTCGWVYFTNKEKAPPGWEYYPQFKQEDLDALALPDEAKGLSAHKYAVITTGVTTPSRHVKGDYWNMIIDYVCSKGLTPVFLGKGLVETGNQRNIRTKFHDEVNYGAGIDLRDKTSLMQAAAVMSKAACVIGHDNGLLHLAGCTDVPIVFGYNLASPEHREPRRPSGNIFNVALDDEELHCNFCQSKTNFLIGYNFQKCFYSDLKCIDLLFADGAAKWRTQIDLALGVRYGRDVADRP